MKYINVANSNPSFNFIPRYYGFEELTLLLKNPITKEVFEVDNIFDELNGYVSISFDFTFANNDKYQITIKDGVNVVYRGNLIATTQTSQSYKLTAGFYRYE
jgi:hypothetical protein